MQPVFEILFAKIVIITELSLNLHQELALFTCNPTKNYPYETDFEPYEKGQH